MPANDFHPVEISFNKLGFFTNIKMDPKLHFAVFWYLHHSKSIREINEELKKAGLRPMIAEELRSFFAVFRFSLQNCHNSNFIITDPGSITKGAGGGDWLQVPAIFKNDRGELVQGYSPEYGTVPEELTPIDHTWIVLAVDEKAE